MARERTLASARDTETPPVEEDEEEEEEEEEEEVGALGVGV